MPCLSNIKQIKLKKNGWEFFSGKVQNKSLPNEFERGIVCQRTIALKIALINLQQQKNAILAANLYFDPYF